MRVLVLSVIYPGVEKYLKYYFESLSRQTQLNYDILIIEDGIKLEQEYHWKNVFIESNNNNNFTPADLRLMGINYATKNNYDIIIFTDSDDYFSNNRVTCSVEDLHSNDVVVNKLIPVSIGGKSIISMNFFEVPFNMDFNKILRLNLYGLSNTAVKVSALPENFYIPGQVIAVDWWIFTLLFLNNRIFKYNSEITTFYRQHSNNLAGLNNFLEKKKLFKGIEVKLIHYTNLLDYSINHLSTKIADELELLIKDMLELKKKVEDEQLCNKYISIINKNYNKINVGWWSDILPISEWIKYG